MIRFAVTFLVLLISLNCFCQQPDSTILKKGVNLSLRYEYDSAEPLLLYAADTSKLTSLRKGIANYHLKRVFRSQNNLKEAFRRGDLALHQFQESESYPWLGETYYSLCMDNLISGAYDIALVQIQNAYSQFESISDTTMMIKSLVRKGIVFHDIEDYSEGIRVCEEADQLRAIFSGKNADLQVAIWGIIAINYDDMGKSDKAVEMYKKILPLQDQLSSERPIIRTYNNMGNSLMKLGRLKEAEKYLKLNLEANQRTQNQYGIATVKTNLGTIAYKNREFANAESLLHEAEELSFSIGDTEKILDVLYQKYLMLEFQNRDSDALDYLKRYHSVKDSLYSLDKQRQIKLLETQFETSKKEQKIALQKAEIAEQETEINQNRTLLIGTVIGMLFIAAMALFQRSSLKKKQQIKLQEALLLTREAEIKATISSQEKERGRYARDLHDGFGQMISILKMNIKNLHGGSKPDERQKVYEASEKVIDEMYGELKNICFDLMPQTLIKYGLESALKEFTERINQTRKIFIELNIFGLESRLSELQEISLYRISQEWINNILKYSDATKVVLQITKDEKEITLLIEDDGMGFDQSLLISGKGNGWKNLNTRAKLIQGELEIETNMNKRGSVIIINAPSVFHKKIEVDQNTVQTV